MSIKIENLSYTYAPGSAYEIHALKNLNLEIEEGQFVGIIGHTGSGKSTLIQLLDGLIKADEGHIYYNGEDIYAPGYSLRSLRKVSLKGWVQRMKGHPFLSATGCHSGTHRRNFYGAAPGYGRHADIFSYRPARRRLPKAFFGNAVKFREGGKGKGGGCSAFPGKIPLLAPICKDSL